MDISNMKAPKLLSTIPGIESLQFNYRMGFYKNIALFPDDRDGVLIADVSDPLNIRTITEIDTPGIPINIRVNGDLAYIADGIGGMGILKLSNASTPVAPPSTDSATTSIINLQMPLFKGPAVEKCVLNTQKTLARLKAENTAFTQTLTVTNTADRGKGSLRWCLENIKQGGRLLFDTKVFNPLKPGVIYLNEPLTFCADNITLDASNAGVILDGGRKQHGTFYVRSNGNVI